ncbi:MAG TPA: hypothetical protein ENI36_00530 [Thermoplasmatales archaeon]|nr:hypothetical protein [Thermoplasmatales archaeon]
MCKEHCGIDTPPCPPKPRLRGEDLFEDPNTWSAIGYHHGTKGQINTLLLYTEEYLRRRSEGEQ